MMCGYYHIQHVISTYLNSFDRSPQTRLYLIDLKLFGYH